MLRLWPTDGREHLKQLTTDLPLWYKYIILYKKSQIFFSFILSFSRTGVSPVYSNKHQYCIFGRTYQHLTNKRTPCPKDNRFKRRTGRIKRPARPHPTTWTNQPRMGGMERTEHNHYGWIQGGLIKRLLII